MQSSRHTRAKDLERTKKQWLEAKKGEADATQIVNKYIAMNKDVNNVDDSKELKLAELKVLYVSKVGKKPPAKFSKKSKMLEEWNRIKMLPALNSITFTEDDENELAKLNSEEVINIDDTELGRKRRRNIMDDASAANLISREQQENKNRTAKHRDETLEEVASAAVLCSD